MSEQTTNIMWMAEQLDFNDLSERTSEQLRQTMGEFLESAANPTLAHSVYPAWR
jgi:2-phosphoglycerate kinase